MRKKIIAANWKMNLTLPEANELVREVSVNLKPLPYIEDILIFVPFPYLLTLKSLLESGMLKIGCQNISSEARGAFTGEVSAEMVRSMGIDYCLIGHSERRIHFGEKGDILRKKVDCALSEGMQVVFCCGENSTERNEGKQFEKVEKQLEESVFHLDPTGFDRIIIAYEPVWAIGTGKTATADQAEEMHAMIRSLVNRKYGSDIADDLYILYGGSCNATNATALFSQPDVDGGLIGGASLKAAEFLSIVSSLEGH